MRCEPHALVRAAPSARSFKRRSGSGRGKLRGGRPSGRPLGGPRRDPERQCDPHGAGGRHHGHLAEALLQAGLGAGALVVAAARAGALAVLSPHVIGGHRGLRRAAAVMHGMWVSCAGACAAIAAPTGAKATAAAIRTARSRRAKDRGKSPIDDATSMANPAAGSSRMLPRPLLSRKSVTAPLRSLPQLTRATSTRLSENVGARPSPDQASDEIEFTDPSERLSERQ